VEFEILLIQPHILDFMVELWNGYDDPDETGRLDDRDGSGGFNDHNGSGGPNDQDGTSGPDDPTRSGGLDDPHGSGRLDDLDVRADSMAVNDLVMPHPNDLRMHDRPKDLAGLGQPNDTSW